MILSDKQLFVLGTIRRIGFGVIGLICLLIPHAIFYAIGGAFIGIALTHSTTSAFFIPEKEWGRKK